MKHVWEKHLQKHVIEIGKAIVGSLGMAFTGGIGIAVAVAMAGLLYLYDDKKKEEPIEAKLKGVLDASKVTSIKAYLSAYQSCFQCVQGVKDYCKIIQSPSYIIEL